MIGMRNRIIHGYDKVDYDIAWRLLAEELPPLVRVIDSSIRRLAPPDNG
jgi:uncharacterized protein with HEPN domain